MLKGCLAVMGEVDGFMFAFGLTLFAGLATGVGSLLAFFTSNTNTKFFVVGVRIFSRCHDLCFHDRNLL